MSEVLPEFLILSDQERSIKNAHPRRRWLEWNTTENRDNLRKILTSRADGHWIKNNPHA